MTAKLNEIAAQIDEYYFNGKASLDEISAALKQESARIEAEIAELRQRLEVAEKDAARYQWLRNSGRVFLFDGADDSGWGADFDSTVNEAADAAILKDKPS